MQIQDYLIIATAVMLVVYCLVGNQRANTYRTGDISVIYYRSKLEYIQLQIDVAQTFEHIDSIREDLEEFRKEASRYIDITLFEETLTQIWVDLWVKEAELNGTINRKENIKK